MSIHTLSFRPRRAATGESFDAELIARHDVSGPRYTSYPTAPQFHERFGETAYREAASASNTAHADRPLSVYVHVPFCFSPCFYCGCTRVITRDRDRGAVYLGYLEREIERTAELFDDRRELRQLHLGGGTPNFYGPAELERLLGTLERHFRFGAPAAREFGIEVDPRHANADSLRELAAIGFNRLSLGIQDFDSNVQAAINRVQTPAQVAELLDAASAFRSVSFDLIYGLPRQTLKGFARTLEEVVALRPQRIAAYAYAHLPERFRAQRRIRSDELPDAATRLALLGLTIETLAAAGYRYIGMDHFALPDDDLALALDQGTLQRNFQGYSTHARSDLIGLGMSSISHVGDTFSQNARDLAAYYGALDSGHLPTQRGLQLDADDILRADVIQQIMCRGFVDIPAVQACHGIDFDTHFAEALARLAPLVEDGLVEQFPDAIVVRPRGRYLLRNIAMCFDAYLGRARGAQVQYSRAV